MKWSEKNTIIGVVGASYSSVTIPFSRATLDRKLPLISYAATNNKLSHHKMFARTVWSDDNLARTITDLIKHFKLSSLKTLGTEGSENARTLDNKIREIQGANITDFKLGDIIKYQL